MTDVLLQAERALWLVLNSGAKLDPALVEELRRVRRMIAQTKAGT